MINDVWYDGDSETSTAYRWYLDYTFFTANNFVSLFKFQECMQRITAVVVVSKGNSLIIIINELI